MKKVCARGGGGDDISFREASELKMSQKVEKVQKGGGKGSAQKIKNLKFGL